MNTQASDRPLDSAGRIHTAAPSARVMVVDDNVDLAETLKVLLEMKGHRVTVAHRGDVAVDVAQSLPLDAVFCDIGLPGLHGYEVATRLRAMVGHRHTVLVAVTGYGDRDSRSRALAAGFDIHFAKPVPPDRLFDVLEHLPRRASST